MNQKIKKSVNWGIQTADHFFGGIPANYLSVVESPNEIIGLASIGSFLAEGVRQEEKCCLVCLESPELVTEKLQSIGFDFSGAIREERNCTLMPWIACKTCSIKYPFIGEYTFTNVNE